MKTPERVLGDGASGDIDEPDPHATPEQPDPSTPQKQEKP